MSNFATTGVEKLQFEKERGVKFDLGESPLPPTHSLSEFIVFNAVYLLHRWC